MLFKRGGFTPEEIAKLNAHTKAMSFDAIYYPGIKVDTAELKQILQDYHDQFFFEGAPADPTAPVGEGAQRQAAARHDHDRRRQQDRGQGRGAAAEGRACPPPCSAGWPGTT